MLGQLLKLIMPLNLLFRLFSFYLVQCISWDFSQALVIGRVTQPVPVDNGTRRLGPERWYICLAPSWQALFNCPCHCVGLLCAPLPWTLPIITFTRGCNPPALCSEGLQCCKWSLSASSRAPLCARLTWLSIAYTAVHTEGSLCSRRKLCISVRDEVIMWSRCSHGEKNQNSAVQKHLKIPFFFPEAFQKSWSVFMVECQVFPEYGLNHSSKKKSVLSLQCFQILHGNLRKISFELEGCYNCRSALCHLVFGGPVSHMIHIAACYHLFNQVMIFILRYQSSL